MSMFDSLGLCLSYFSIHFVVINCNSFGFSIADFEYTSECIIFDLLRIPLYHGWLVNPTESETFRVVNTLSYNQLVDRIITNKGSTDPNVNSESMLAYGYFVSDSDALLLLVTGFIAEEFLNQSASQLTNYGLSQLIHKLNEEELCILFRNNHFITLHKFKVSNLLFLVNFG